jgi:hypothetical protein
MKIYGCVMCGLGEWFAKRTKKQKIIMCAVGVILALAIIQSFTGTPTV